MPKDIATHCLNCGYTVLLADVDPITGWGPCCPSRSRTERRDKGLPRLKLARVDGDENGQKMLDFPGSDAIPGNTTTSDIREP